MTNSPFKFLDSYTKEDKDIFFGRDSEIEKLYSLVFESKTLLVYGISGTGKSSLIHCGLANKFNEADWLPINIRRGNNMLESFWIALEKTAITPLKKPEKITAVKIKKAIKSIYLDHFKPVFFIFDQFEELFVFGSDIEQKEFLEVLKSILDSDIQSRFIFVIREEYLAMFTEFESAIPTILDNRLRIEKMTRENARQVIEGPCGIFDIAVEEDFAQTLLQKLSPQQNQVELTYLQVYLDKLYRMAQEAKKENEPLNFTKSLIDQSGNISDLLGSFLEEQIAQLSEPAAGLKVLKAFVSTKGTKRQINTKEAQNYIKTLGADLPQEQINQLITQFVNLRILRDKDEANRYELRHDALAAKIFEKITLAEKELLEMRQFIEHAYDNFQKREILLSQEDLDYVQPYLNKLFLEEKFKVFLEKSRRELLKVKRRRQTIILSATLLLISILVGFSWWAISERIKSDQLMQAAEQKEVEFKALYYNSLSKETDGNDPTQAFRIAEYAYSLDSSNQDIYQNILDNFYKNTLLEKILTFENENRSQVVYSSKYKLFAYREGDIIKIHNIDSIIKEIDVYDKKMIKFLFHPIRKEFWCLVKEGKHIFLEELLSKEGVNRIEISDQKTYELLIKRWNYFSSIRSVTFSPLGNYLIFRSHNFDTTNEYMEVSSVLNLKDRTAKIFDGHLYFSKNEERVLISNKLLNWKTEKIIVEYAEIDKVDFLGKYIVIKDEAKRYHLVDFNGNIVSYDIGLSNDSDIVNVDIDNNYIFVWNKNYEGTSIDVLNFNNELLEHIKLPAEKNNYPYPKSVFSFDGYVYIKTNEKGIFRIKPSLPRVVSKAGKFWLSNNGKYLLIKSNDSLFMHNNTNKQVDAKSFPYKNETNYLNISNSGEIVAVSRNGEIKYFNENEFVSRKISSSIGYLQDVIIDTERECVISTISIEKQVRVGQQYHYKVDGIASWDFSGKKRFEIETIPKYLLFGKSLNNSFILFSTDSVFQYDYDGVLINKLKLKNSHNIATSIIYNFNGKYVGDLVYWKNTVLLSEYDSKFKYYDLSNKKVRVCGLNGAFEDSISLNVNVAPSTNIVSNSLDSLSFLIGKGGFCQFDSLGFIYDRNTEDLPATTIINKGVAYYEQNGYIYRKEIKEKYRIKNVYQNIQPLNVDFILKHKLYTLDELFKQDYKYSLSEQLSIYLNAWLNTTDSISKVSYCNNIRRIAKEMNYNKIDYIKFFNFLIHYNRIGVITMIKENIDVDTVYTENTMRVISDAAQWAATSSLFEGKNNLGLEFALLAMRADAENDYLYKSLAPLYLVNNRWESAKAIYEKYQDSMCFISRKEKAYRKVFLEDLNKLEENGITHPNFQKVRELLGETKETEEQEPTKAE